MQRHNYFSDNGCRVSDHGLEHIYAEEYTESEIAAIFQKILKRVELSQTEVFKFKSAMLVEFAEWDHAKGWVQQYHLGALRNNNSRMLQLLAVIFSTVFSVVISPLIQLRSVDSIATNQ